MAKVEDIDFIEVIQNVQDTISSQIDGSNAIVKSDFAVEAKVKYNKIQAESLILNLLTNSIKYKSPDRPLTIKIKTEIIENYFCIIVEDNGLGIDLPNDIDKVFGLFKRAHPEIAGSGIGLYMTKQALVRLGGKITVESEIDKGTIFKVFLQM